jgi:sugar phosphate isomerase/epimerase
MVILLGIALLTTSIVPPETEAPWSPALYAFCMQTHDAKHRLLPEQVQMLRELGFDGIAYSQWLNADLESYLRVVDEAGLNVYMLEASVNINPDEPPYPADFLPAIRRLKGRSVTISVTLRGFPPGDPRGEEPATRLLRELGDVAAACGLRISL